MDYAAPVFGGTARSFLASPWPPLRDVEDVLGALEGEELRQELDGHSERTAVQQRM